jgi:effector-binding domain-containing protein
MDVDFGVEVSGAFDGDGEVRPARTPAGEVARTSHIGSYDRLRDAHDAVLAWCAGHGRTIGGASWEIYGDPADDGSVEVQVLYLLA